MTPFERELASVAPASSRLDRDALMYAAGKQSTLRSRLWPVAAGGFALIALGLGVRLATMPPQMIEKVVVVRETISEPLETIASPSAPDVAVQTTAKPDAMATAPPSAYATLMQMTSAQIDPVPSIEKTTDSTGKWTSPITPPLEQDLGMPPGSLHDLQPQNLPHP
jgi:hypothetical protein